MLNLQPVPREAQLDIDLCRTCRDSCDWAVMGSWMWSKDRGEAIPLMRWVPCPDCNPDEHKPMPWDT